MQVLTSILLPIEDGHFQATLTPVTLQPPGVTSHPSASKLPTNKPRPCSMLQHLSHCSVNHELTYFSRPGASLTVTAAAAAAAAAEYQYSPANAANAADPDALLFTSCKAPYEDAYTKVWRAVSPGAGLVQEQSASDRPNGSRASPSIYPLTPLTPAAAATVSAGPVRGSISHQPSPSPSPSPSPAAAAAAGKRSRTSRRNVKAAAATLHVTARTNPAGPSAAAGSAAAAAGVATPRRGNRRAPKYMAKSKAVAEEETAELRAKVSWRPSLCFCNSLRACRANGRPPMAYHEMAFWQPPLCCSLPLFI